MARKTTASSAVIESKELRSYRLARTISLIAVIALIVWLLRGSLVGKAFKAAAASGAGPIGYLAWALYALSAVFVLCAPLLLLHHVSFSRLYRSALERSTFPAELGLTYWRETLPALRPACISMLADLEIEPKKDAAAQLLRLEMQGLIRVVERNGAPVAEVVDQAAEGFTESDRILVDIASSAKLPKAERQRKLDEWQTLEEDAALRTPYFRQLPKRGSSFLFFVLLSMSMFLITPFVVVVSTVVIDSRLVFTPDNPAFYQQFATMPGLLLGLVCVLVLMCWFALVAMSGYVYMVGSAVGERVNKKERFTRTEEGERVTELVFGLKNYIRDFTKLSEADKGAAAFWDDFLVYAVVLEENEQVVGQLLEERGLAARWKRIVGSLGL